MCISVRHSHIIDLSFKPDSIWLILRLTKPAWLIIFSSSDKVGLVLVRFFALLLTLLLLEYRLTSSWESFFLPHPIEWWTTFLERIDWFMSAMAFIVVSKLALVLMVAYVLRERWKRWRLSTIGMVSLSVHLRHHSFHLIKYTPTETTMATKMALSPELVTSSSSSREYIIIICWICWM